MCLRYMYLLNPGRKGGKKDVVNDHDSVLALKDENIKELENRIKLLSDENASIRAANEALKTQYLDSKDTSAVRHVVDWRSMRAVSVERLPTLDGLPERTVIGQLIKPDQIEDFEIYTTDAEHKALVAQFSEFIKNNPPANRNMPFSADTAASAAASVATDRRTWTQEGVSEIIKKQRSTLSLKKDKQ